MLPLVNRLHASLIAALLAVQTLGGCSTDSEGAKGDAKQGGEKASPNDLKPTQPKLGADGKPLGSLSASEHIDLRKIVNKTPPEVDAVLGEPTGTGSDRVSCVRFVPERVFFACEQDIRVYAHPKFESVRVEFEDGHAAVVAIAGLPGAGSFDPKAALATVGLELPGEPRHDNPPLDSLGGDGSSDMVDRWEWGNSRARLLIDGLEHRVRLTVVNGDWARAKLELINNNPLSPEQKERIKLPRGTEPASSGTEAAPSEPAGELDGAARGGPT
jgi:hypothetical protein